MNNLNIDRMLIIPELESWRSLLGLNTLFTIRGKVTNYEKPVI